MKITPLNKRVVIKRADAEIKTAGGLYLPDSAKEKAPRGTVVALASDCSVALDLGQTVLFHERAGYPIELDGSQVEYLVLNETDLIGVIR